jgi:hypothetical protein
MQCAAKKLSFDPKQDDFAMNDLDISAFADPVTNSRRLARVRGVSGVRELIPGIEHDFGGGRKLSCRRCRSAPCNAAGRSSKPPEAASASDPAAIGTVIEAAHAALKRNYPDITRDEVGELVDVGNMHDVIGLRPGRRRRASASGGRGKKPPGPDGGGGRRRRPDWAGLIARVCANTGWTWSYVREHVDLPTVDALERGVAAAPAGAPPGGRLPGLQAARKAGGAPGRRTCRPLLGEFGATADPCKAAPIDTSAFDAQQNKEGPAMSDSDKQVSYGVSADASPFEQGMQRGRGLAQGFAGQVNIDGHFKKVQDAFGAVQKQLLVLAGIVAGGAFFKDAINESNQLTGETLKLSKALGINAEEAGTLRTALEDIGSSGDEYVDTFTKFARQLKNNEDGLRAMGLQTRDANGNLRDSKELFTEALSPSAATRPASTRTPTRRRCSASRSTTS